MDDIPPTLEGWVYIIPIHEPIDGPLHMGSHIHQQFECFYYNLTGIYDS